MNVKLKEKIMESLSSVAPITAIVLLLSFIMVPMDVGTVVMFLTGALLLIVGMGLFQLGVEMSMTPMGEGLGIQLSKSKKIGLVIIIGFAMGVIVTIAEPDLQVLANQVPAIPNNVLVLTVAVGVGIFLALAIARILFRISLSKILIVSYISLFVLSIFVPGDFVSVAFDSGGVTTGPITVPFIMAMGVGLAAIRSDKDASSDSFGLVALSSAGPILAVMLLGIFYNPSDSTYSKVEVPQVATTQDVMHEFGHGMPHYFYEVLIAIVPIIAVFIIMQLITRRFRRRQRMRMSVGFVYTYLGLVLFLSGVNIGFLPVGHQFGADLASSSFSWLLVPIGMLIGFFIVKAEPAVQVLNRQVEDVTNGAITHTAMNRCMQIGVAASVGLSMVRVLTGVSIYAILIPGYAIALVLTFFVPKIFVGIAFDSGGVASGPMTSCFLLPLAIGASEAAGGNVMTDAFGVVAFVAMTPLIAIQIMGLVYAIKQKRAKPEDTDVIVLEDSGDLDEIIEYEEDSINE